MKKSALLIAITVLAAGVAAHEAKSAKGAGHVRKAIAVLHPAKDTKVEGTITFEAAGSAVKVGGTVTGLAAGTHGFHVHEFGDCSAADFLSAGGHFNPADQPHGAPTDAKRHAGDLGNVEAGQDGTATVALTDKALHLDGPHGVVGHAVIVHANADDLKTQPTGNAGGRVACGVIGVAKAE